MNINVYLKKQNHLIPLSLALANLDKRFAFLLLLTIFIYFSFGCGNTLSHKEEITVKSLSCEPADKYLTYDEVVYAGAKGGKTFNYTDIREGLISGCASCHQAPSNSGGFTFIDSYKGEVKTIGGQTQFFNGYYEIAEQVLSSLNHQDEKLRMPPKNRRDKNLDVYRRLSQQIESWIAAEKPQSTFVNIFTLDSSSVSAPQMRGSDQGECTPHADIIGFDLQKDKFFEGLQKLPQDLSETDLNTLDAYQLAQKGTLAYTVEYPLWADNSGKGRFVHFPVKRNLLGQYRVQKAQYDQESKQFILPDNTRFYKNFYKKVKLKNGQYRFRRIETRIIVTRTPWQSSLYGTYKWDETEQSATLVNTPYRDGTGFKDQVFKVVVDENTLKTRDYMIPGLQRCLDCHRGWPMNNGVLGFTPLQLNRRLSGEFTLDGEPAKTSYLSENEKTQIQRFIDYGIIENTPTLNQWPKLETLSDIQPRNIYEYKAQGYLQGNCAHCHNPKGLAFTPENGVTLDLTAPSIFQFNTKQRSVQVPSRLIVHQNGDLDQSHIFRKVSDSTQQLGLTSQMPMNTGGAPDCEVLTVVGQWIKSFESLEVARNWKPECKKENPINLIDQDFTIADDPLNYIPKRADWRDVAQGMSEKYKNLSISNDLLNAFSKTYAVGYWSKKEQCQFPEKTLTEAEIRPWMMRGSKPKRPFGEVYYTTPGSWYYRTSCMKCHGENAKGDSSLAKAILTWSGGQVRVANFMDGMFGNKNENLKKFSDGNRDLAPNYLVWMAMEGTRVQFPSELSSFLGKHGGQMLNQMRDKCLNQISPKKPSSVQFMDHEIFNKICFIDNLQKNDPLLAFDDKTQETVYPEVVEQWADRAAYNIGFSIFDYLKQKSAGQILPGNDQCEILYEK